MLHTRNTQRRSLMAGAAVLVLALAAPMFGETAPASVNGKMYAVNVLTSFGTSFTDCFLFKTGNVFEIQGCGDSGPYGEQPLFGLTFATAWAGKVPCSGLNIQWFGSATFGAGFQGGGGTDVIGGTAVGESQGTTFAVNGTAVLSCPAAAARNGINYTKP